LPSPQHVGPQSNPVGQSAFVLQVPVEPQAKSFEQVQHPLTLVKQKHCPELPHGELDAGHTQQLASPVAIAALRQILPALFSVAAYAGVPRLDNTGADQATAAPIPRPFSISLREIPLSEATRHLPWRFRVAAV